MAIEDTDSPRTHIREKDRVIGFKALDGADGVFNQRELSKGFPGPVLDEVFGGGLDAVATSFAGEVEAVGFAQAGEQGGVEGDAGGEEEVEAEEGGPGEVHQGTGERVAEDRTQCEAEQAKRLAQAQSQEAALARKEADLAFAAAESLRLQLQTMTATSEARGQVMTLSGEAFASGQSQLKPEARDNLQRVVEFVNRFPDKAVLIEGHADSQGSANLNQVLSQKRAEAVRDALLQDGVAASRLTAVGLGKDRPVADNASAEGRARNRRVEIVVLDAR